MTTEPPTEADLCAALTEVLHERVTSVERRPYPLATSFPLEELSVLTESGAHETIILKELVWTRLLSPAIGTKPKFLHEPRRSRDTYQRILAPRGIGPRYWGSVDRPDGVWLFLEKVDGTELWQEDAIETWEAVTRWLAELHAALGSDPAWLRAANPYLLDYDQAWFHLWRRRAEAALVEDDDPRARVLGRRLVDVDPEHDRVTELVTFVHGEFYPSNIMIGDTVPGGTTRRVCPIDWEMAGIGSGLLDLATLVDRWAEPAQDRLVEVYRRALESAGSDPGDDAGFRRGLDRARLHLALRWLGWSSDWEAPLEHAYDWIGEALTALDNLD